MPGFITQYTTKSFAKSNLLASLTSLPLEGYSHSLFHFQGAEKTAILPTCLCCSLFSGMEPSHEPSVKQLSRKQKLATECRLLAYSMNGENIDSRHETTSSTAYKPALFLRAKNNSSLRFDWWEDRFDVLSSFKVVLPPPVSGDPTILARLPPSERDIDEIAIPSEDIETELPPAKRPRTQSSGSSGRMTLPKHYYKPWPEQTHKLPFPGKEYYKFAEATVSTLVDYRTRLQSDDSIELGLRIAAHVLQEKTSLTIIPSTAVWHMLSRFKNDVPNDATENLQATVNDLRRIAGPYISTCIGLTPGYSTMFLHERHWYAIILLGAEKLMEVLIGTMGTVIESCSDSASFVEINSAYSACFQNAEYNNIALVAIDSLGIQIRKKGWEQVRAYVIVCILQSLSTKICTSGTSSGLESIQNLSLETQELHIMCITLKAVRQLLWPFRIHIEGPRQPDGRSCGAYGLTTIWKLGHPEVLEVFTTFVKDKLTNTRKGRSRKVGIGKVRMVKFTDFYSDEAVETVMKNFDSFIRSEVINKK